MRAWPLPLFLLGCGIDPLADTCPADAVLLARPLTETKDPAPNVCPSSDPKKKDPGRYWQCVRNKGTVVYFLNSDGKQYFCASPSDCRDAIEQVVVWCDSF